MIQILKFIRYWIPVFFIASVIFYLSSIPQSELPHIDFPYLDKIVHFSIYSFLGFSFCRAMTQRLRSDWIPTEYLRPLIFGIALTTAYGAFDEWRQSFTPGRSVEGLDLLADFLGGCFGAYLTIVYRAWVIRFEAKKASLKS